MRSETSIKSLFNSIGQLVEVIIQTHIIDPLISWNPNLEKYLKFKDEPKQYIHSNINTTDIDSPMVWDDIDDEDDIVGI